MWKDGLMPLRRSYADAIEHLDTTVVRRTPSGCGAAIANGTRSLKTRSRVEAARGACSQFSAADTR
jgi:hypothetical protein